jgi:predicted RNase H-like nuclease
MIAIGLDGFRRGWVAVRIDGRKRDIHFLDQIDELLALRFDRAAIDIPIGLPDTGDRVCDLHAKRALGRNSPRVFTGARRGLWQFESYALANAALKSRGEAGVSIQLWNLGSKIIEADAIMTPARQRRIYEAHPELVFQRLNGGRPLDSKKEPRGLRRRRALLIEDGFAAQALDDWLNGTRIGTGAKSNDVLDACACAIAARDLHMSLPAGRAPRDAKGLKMQIWR